jgi:D-glycero-alpha-D-manno-heptose-7-phosphate kinase
MSNPTVRAAAPLRISFVGGGTDFPHYFRREGGAVLSATIDHYAWVTIQRRPDREIRIRSLDLGHRVGYQLDEDPVYDGVMDLAKAAIQRVGVEGGIEVDVSSDAPPGSGLGGSSALVTAIVGGLAALNGSSYSREEVARLSTVIEREDIDDEGRRILKYSRPFAGVINI